jgi:hypothetical protein
MHLPQGAKLPLISTEAKCQGNNESQKGFKKKKRKKEKIYKKNNHNKK